MPRPSTRIVQSSPRGPTTSPAPSEDSIGPSDSASNPPTKSLSSSAKSKSKSRPESESGSKAKAKGKGKGTKRPRPAEETDVEGVAGGDIKPDVGTAATGAKKRVKVEPGTAFEAGGGGPRSGGGAGGGGKARVSADAKRLIAEETVTRGVAALDIGSLAAQTGLTAQQIRSQIADNRQNLRWQLVQLCRTLQ